MDDINWQKVFAQYSYFVEFYTEDKTYVAKCMEFPTLTITGKSREESIRNLQKFLVPELQNFKAKNGDFPKAIAQGKNTDGPFVREVIRKALSAEKAS
jgi:hypothetical protein